jgi:hypothetical protein
VIDAQEAPAEAASSPVRETAVNKKRLIVEALCLAAVLVAILIALFVPTRDLLVVIATGVIVWLALDSAVPGVTQNVRNLLKRGPLR